MIGLIVGGATVFLGGGLILNNIRIVQQSDAYVIERLGAYKETWSVGLHFKVPFIESVQKKVSLKEQVVDFPPQPVITKDNVTMQIDTVVYYQITDPKLYAYGIENPIVAIENLTATSLRNLIGELDLDETLSSRDIVNTKMRAILDKATDSWGIKVNRVELKNIMPPREIQEAMEKQMKAEREKREAVLNAQAEKESAVLRAQGHKESAILNAEAEKQSAILRAEAEKEKRIKEAEGEAEAILIVQKATAEGIELINSSKPTQEMIALRSLEALEKVADGQATKIIIPSEIQNIAGLVASLKEVSIPTKKTEEE
ncbi:SPFH domain-containing protein [Bacillus sp. M6-12]|uniref:SPFH domain-containing protein n=1 Tax=Bacillus sp. M6-12 TaxID=2054166 RepID=UPI002155EF12|nr:SPFH domain-containing protein [Bacillus sp. M6-12]